MEFYAANVPWAKNGNPVDRQNRGIHGITYVYRCIDIVGHLCSA